MPTFYQLECRLAVVYKIYPPDKRQRDLGNLDKLLSDCFTKAGVWADDSLIDDLRFLRNPPVKDGLVVAEITTL